MSKTFGSLTQDSGFVRIALLFVVLSGALLRLWQYAANSSLWLDEAALARNIIERSPRELLEPLSYGQVAPIGFLFIQKAIVGMAGASEYVLRAFPIASGLASILLFTLVARATLTGGAVAYAVLLFALAQPFVYLSSQAKQYASDVMASLLALLIASRILEAPLPRWQTFTAAAAGVLIPWLSTSGALVLLGAAFGAAVPGLLQRGSVPRSVLPLAILWTVSAVAAGLLALRTVSAESREYLDWFWRIGYMPLSPPELVRWGWNTLNNVFGSFGNEAFRTNGGFAYAWPELFAVTTLVGLMQLARTGRVAALILFGPLAVVLAGALLRLYPATGRLLVFIVPVLLLATAAGAQAVWTWFGRRARMAGAVAALLFVAVPIHAAIKTRPPYFIQPLRPVLERVALLRQPGDVMYIDYAAGQAFLYYAPRFGFEENAYLIGRCSLSDRRDYLRQVDRFRGERRMWIIATHLSAVEQPLTVGYLEQIGRRIESVFVPPTGAPLRFAAYARLYDLSDRVRLARSSAATHRIHEVPLDANVLRWGCFGPAVPLE